MIMAVAPECACESRHGKRRKCRPTRRGYIPRGRTHAARTPSTWWMCCARDRASARTNRNAAVLDGRHDLEYIGAAGIAEFRRGENRSPMSDDTRMSMNLPCLIVPKRHVDDRGWFSET